MTIGLQLIRVVVETSARSEFRHLQEALFVEEELAAYRFVNDFYRRHGQLPSFGACTENGHLLPIAPNPVSYYLERVHSRAVFNAITAEQGNLRSAMVTRNSTDAIATLERMRTAVGIYTPNQDIATVAELTVEVMEDYHHSHRNVGNTGITLGSDRLNVLTGGAEAGDVITLVARPSQGKSYLLTNMAYRAWKDGNSVLFVTTEMTGKQIARRIVGIEAGINPRYIRRGTLSFHAEQMMADAVGSIAAAPPWHMVSCGLDNSVGLIDSAIQEFSPEIVYVDASYLLNPSAKNSKYSQHELLASVGKEIRQIALYRQRPIVQTVQFNRQAKQAKASADLEHIGGTDVVGQISTIVISISQGDIPYEATRRKLKIIKNREDELGAPFHTHFTFNPPNFSDVVEDGADDGFAEFEPQL